MANAHLTTTGRALALLAVHIIAGREAHARAVPRPHGPELKRAQPATHVIAELRVGVTTTGDDGGIALEGLVGIGRTFRRFPLPLYLIGEAAYGGATLSNANQLNSLPYRDERTYGDMSGGVRIQVPYGPVSMVVDALVGGSHVTAVLDAQGMAPRTAERWLPLVALACGLQFRVSFLSIGTRVKFVIQDDDVAGFRRLVGAKPSAVRAMLTAGVTWHF